MGRHARSRHAGPRRIRVRRTGRVRALLSLGLVIGLVQLGTMAYWTDEAVVTGGTFQTGTIDVKAGSPAVDNNPPAFSTSFTMENMVPGSTKDAPLLVTNDGTVPFTFLVNGSATNSGAGTNQLGAALRISVFPSESGGGCTGTALASDLPVNGAVLPTQSVLAAAPDPNTRQYCFRATLPSNASTDLQGMSSVVTLTVVATSVAP
ncbi:MAG: SipW-dependent-type signal peptide-containing protein [Nocardioides sp.]|nr:SipW-dependent-type signal peptide-containing protein [Nocardioides sp.]